MDKLMTTLDWISQYSLHIALFLLGVLTVSVVWMVKHPEDFFYEEVEDDEAEER